MAFDKNLEKLNRLLSLLDSDQLTKEDFISAFENVVKKVIEIEKRNSVAIDTLEKTYANLLDKIRNDHTSSLSDLKKQVNEVFVGDQLAKIKLEHDNKMFLTDQKIASVKNGLPGLPGKNVDEQKVIESVMSQITLLALKSIENKLPFLTGKIRDNLEILKGNDRLDKSAIRGLSEELSKISSNVMGQGAGGGAKGRIHYADLTSQCNGVLKTFKIPSNFGVFGVWSTQAPMNYRPMIDWTTGDKTLTLTSEVGAPQTGQTLWIGYTK